MSADLVASAHFRRMDGMLWECANGHLMRLDAVHAHSYWDGLDSGRPVTEDPATLGCLLHLVREALGGVVSLETLWSGSLGRWVYHVKLADADPHHRYVASGATPAEALTAALLAAPPKCKGCDGHGTYPEVCPYDGHTEDIPCPDCAPPKGGE